MRIRSLGISGFRGFSGSEHFDLDAEAVIVVGANGQGKTSLFDAVLWAIAGRVPRLRSEDDHLLSLFSSSGEARVSLSLRGDDGDDLVITRRFDGEQQHLLLEHHGQSRLGTTAASGILEALWPSSVATQDPVTALTSAFTRSVYLQQDLVREFIETDDEQRRFSVVSELCGAGRVVELQHQLERSRNAWSRTSGSMQPESDELREQLGALEAQLARLQEGTGVDEQLRAEWNDWWAKALELGVGQAGCPEIRDADAASRLDAAVGEVRTRRQPGERALDACRRLRQEGSDRVSVPRSDLDAMRAQLESLRTATNEARRVLTEAQGRAAEERRRQVEQRERHQELAALAQIALRHLEARCPVCNQEYDHDMAREHLQSHLALAVTTSPATRSDEVSELASVVEERERSLATFQERFQQAQSSELEMSLWETDRNRRLAELGIEPAASEDLIAALGERIDSEAGRCADLRTLQEGGEALSLRLARASESARREEIQRQARQLGERVRETARALQARQATAELASRIIDQLREASLEVVAAQVDQIAPLLQRIYATADPHPAFRSVRLLSRIFRGRGRLSAAIDDLVESKTSQAPELVLSSSQMNALAVSIFLALNLGVPAIPLSTAMLDDPLQSLDDVNLLGLIDLLRRLTSKRQLIVSTHDQRFGRLLERKLRPVSEEQRTRVIQLEGWGRDGPQVRQYDVERDPRVLRIAAA